jgi:septum formation protein
MTTKKYIMQKNILLLASSSQSRQTLLQQSLIPFKVIEQTADEELCDHTLPLDQLVMCVARLKMEHIVMPEGMHEGEISFVLTADTLSQDATGAINKKPIDRADARRKIQAARNGCHLSTAFCLEKRIWKDNEWHATDRIERVVSADYRCNILDNEIDYYLDNSLGLKASGAIAVEGFGSQFLEYVHGSYSTIVGLPLFEVREALHTLGFFE